MKAPFLFDPPACSESDFHPLPLPVRCREPRLVALFVRETVRVLWLVGLVVFVVALVVGAVALGGYAAMTIFFPPER